MKTKDNCPSILSYFLPGIFPPFFFEFSTFNEERKKRQFRGNKNYLSFGVSETECSQNPAHMQWNAIFIAYVVQTGFFSFCWFLATLMEEKSLAQENLACLYLLEICILYGNTAVCCKKSLNLECPMPRWWQAF